ncbi:MAG: hypothetical protein QXI58_01815 [Candidatus Micrarchaeia archaeon]
MRRDTTIGQEAYAAVETPDSCYIVVCGPAVKIDREGNIKWVKYGNWRTILRTSDGNYLLYGGTLSKIDEEGNTLWEKYIPGSIIEERYPDILETQNGFIVNTTGNIVWTDFWGNTIRYITCPYVTSGIRPSPDGGYICAIYNANDSIGDYTGCYKIDSIGNLIWEKKYYISDWIFITDFHLLWDGYYAAFGEVRDPYGWMDLYLMKIDQNGDTLWTKRYGTQYIEGGGLAGGIPTSDRGYLLVGYYSGSVIPGDALAIKTAPDVKIKEKKNLILKSTKEFYIMYDILGRKIKEILPQNSKFFNFSPGIYFLRDKNKFNTKKVIILK